MKKLPLILFLCVLVVGVGLRLVVCALPTERLIVPSLFDDTFIGLKMSRNMAQGKWITWDGVTKTNAVTNPLYLALMAPVYFIFQPRWDFSLHVILGLSALADGVAIWLLYSFVSYLAGRRAGLFAAVLWAFNPYVISFNLSGSEHAFESLGFIASLYFYVRVIKLGGRRTAGRYFLLGLLLGITAMFRVSLLFLFLFVLGDIVLGWWRSRGSERFRPSFLVNPLAMAVAFSLVLLPWMVYSFREFGTIMPHNAGLISYYNHNWYLLSNPGFLNWLQAEVRFILNVFNCWAEIFGLGLLALSNPYPSNIIGGVSFADLVMVFRMVLMVVVGTILYFSVKRLVPREPRLSRLSSLGFAFVTVLFLGLYYGGVQWKLDKRYFIEAIMMFSIAVSILAVLFIDGLWGREGIRRKGRTILGAVMALALLNYGAMGLWVWQNGPEGVGCYSLNHRSMLKGALWANRNLPGDAVVGAFNPGIYGYYMRNPVVDIVGIANEDAWKASKRGELLKYIWERKVDYILDFAVDIDIFYPHYLTAGDDSFLEYIIEGPLFNTHQTPIHLYIVKGPDGRWNGLSLEELNRRSERDSF